MSFSMKMKLNQNKKRKLKINERHTHTHTHPLFLTVECERRAATSQRCHISTKVTDFFLKLFFGILCDCVFCFKCSYSIAVAIGIV